MENNIIFRAIRDRLRRNYEWLLQRISVCQASVSNRRASYRPQSTFTLDAQVSLHYNSITCRNTLITEILETMGSLGHTRKVHRRFRCLTPFVAVHTEVDIVFSKK